MFVPRAWGDVPHNTLGVVFVAVISQIGSSGIPIVTELTLRIPSAEPVEAHVCGFGAFGEDGIFCDPRCGQVFHL